MQDLTAPGFREFPHTCTLMPLKWRYAPRPGHSLLSLMTMSPVHMVLNDLANLAAPLLETDELEADDWTTIANIVRGEYSNPVRVVAFNIAGVGHAEPRLRSRHHALCYNTSRLELR